MPEATELSLRRTVLDSMHDAAGARMVPFAGWRMPLQFEGIIAEHHAVRERAGLFDVSHMGELRVRGTHDIEHVQALLSNDLARIAAVGDAQYSMLLSDDAGIEDDLIVYRTASDELLLVVNASNRERVAELLDGIAVDESDDWCMFALQGPLALAVLADVVGVDLRGAGSFQSTLTSIAGSTCIIATTGYTGEPGCELLVPTAAGCAVWSLLVADERVSPCGLGARDTLRLEACFPLHGNDLDTTRNPLAAGLGFAAPASLDELDAPAHRSLRRLRVEPAPEVLRSVLIEGKGIPRAGMRVQGLDGRDLGVVTSGTMSPILRQGIALAWLDREHADIGMRIEIDIRGRPTPASIVRRPFVTSGASA